MLKVDVRRNMLARRRSLTGVELEERSEKLREMLFNHFNVTGWNWLHVFLPAAHFNEPDTWKIIHWLWAQGLPTQIAVPVVQPDGVRLRHYELTPTTQLASSRWGIPEPVGAAEVFPSQLDAVLVPLLAFDDVGHRVGYGKGFYDRFLAECSPATQRIGLSLEPPVASIDDAWPGDERLHACVTPTGVWRF